VLRRTRPFFSSSGRDQRQYGYTNCTHPRRSGQAELAPGSSILVPGSNAVDVRHAVLTQPCRHLKLAAVLFIQVWLTKDKPYDQHTVYQQHNKVNRMLLVATVCGLR